MKHQREMVLFASPLDYCALIAGYGCGKTLTALWLIEKMKWNIVIIVSTKTALESTWEDEIKKHSNFLYAHVVGDLRQKIYIIRAALSRHRSGSQTLILLVNFDGVKNILDSLAALKPDAVIADESLQFKNPDTLRSKVMWALSRAVPKRFLLAGNIFSESLTEIYSQVKYLDRGGTFGNSYKQFLKDYFEKKKNKYVPKKGMTQKIFNLIKPFTTSVPENVIQRPPAIPKKIGLHPTAQQRDLLDKLKNDFNLELGKVHVDITSIYALVGKCQQICDGFITDNKGNIVYIETPKDEALIDELEEIGRHEKVIIWAYHKPVIKKLYRILTKLGYGVLVINGETKDSGVLVRQFQNSNRYNIFLLSLKKANSSITVTNSRCALYYSQSWSFNEMDNSHARNRRIGSEKHDSIMYGYFYLKDTVSEQIYNCWITKGDLVKTLRKYFK